MTGRWVFAFLLLSCVGERAALLRGQGYYEDNQFERALSVWRDLERHEPALTPSQFARYAYLRGMTDYRLGFHADARHWLSLAKVSERQHPGGLEGAWLPRLDGALADLDRESFGIPAGQADRVQSIDAQSIDAQSIDAQSIDAPTVAPPAPPGGPAAAGAPVPPPPAPPAQPN
ncbi:MAG: hypothetical protein ABI895_36185 [Deltaproteobacteria bacterium]